MLIGNVGRDPELKFTPSGIPVTTFRLATSETWKDRNGNLQEHTDWHTVVAWRGLAEVCHKLLRKGARIYLEGKLQTRSIEDKNTNTRRNIVEVIAENMIVLDARKQKENGEAIEEKNITETLYPDTTFDESDFSDFDTNISDTFDETFDFGDEEKKNDESPF
jgi:single-strand DNA-binding protein